MKEFKKILKLVSFGFLTILFLPGCEKKYEAPVPDTSWDLFDSPSSIPLSKTSRQFMEGVYKITDGTNQFGDLAAIKWSYLVTESDTTFYVSIFCAKDIGYFICEGKQSGDSIIMNGYWRKMVNVETGVARFTIAYKNGGRQLLSDAPQILSDSIIMNGVWGTGGDIPSRKVSLSYVRPVNSQPFEILGHRAGGRTSDHLPFAENSIGMIRYASRLGATGIEIDIRMTSDGVPILYHDNTLNPRLVQKNALVGPIENYSFQQINTLVKLIDGESVPTLDAALHEVLYNTPIRFVWLDTKHPESLNAIRELQKIYLQRASEAGRDLNIVIGLPEEDIVKAFLALQDFRSAPSLCELSISDVESTNAQVWGPPWTLGMVDAEIAEIRSQGRKAIVWTLDNPAYVDQFITHGNFDGILSNYPSIVAYYHYVKE